MALSLEETPQFAKDYYNSFISGFLYNDIQNCINAKANFVVALALMTYTEYFGGLLTGNLGEPFGFTKSNFNAGLANISFNGDPNYYINFKIKLTKGTDTQSVGIYELFRCGLVHEYWAKGLEKIIIHNEPSYLPTTDAGIGWVVVNKNGTFRKDLRFHCNAYFRDFKDSVSNYFRELIEEKEEQKLKFFAKAIGKIEESQIQEPT